MTSRWKDEIFMSTIRHSKSKSYRDSSERTTISSAHVIFCLRFYNTGLTTLASSVFGASSGTLASLNIKYSPEFTTVDSTMVSN